MSNEVWETKHVKNSRSYDKYERFEGVVVNLMVEITLSSMHG